MVGIESRKSSHSCCWPNRKTRKGAALLLALFVMTVSSALVLAIVDSQSLRYTALRNTRQWDQARYLAEAGLHDALSRLEADFSWRDGIGWTEFPPGTGDRYSVQLIEDEDGNVILTAVGSSGNFTRTLAVTVKQGD